MLFVRSVPNYVHSHLSPSRCDFGLVLLAIQRLHWKCLGLIAKLKGAHTEAVKKKGVHYSFTFLTWVCPKQSAWRLKGAVGRHPQASFPCARAVSKTFRSSRARCILSDIQRLQRLDAPLSRLIFRECVQLLNHLGLVARQHLYQNRCFHFLSASPVICLVLFMYISLRENGGGGGKPKKEENVFERIYNRTRRNGKDTAPS